MAAFCGVLIFIQQQQYQFRRLLCPNSYSPMVSDFLSLALRVVRPTRYNVQLISLIADATFLVPWLPPFRT
jgi:hypothetical protein